MSATLPVYGLLFGANALFSPDDSPSDGRPLYGLLFPVNAFFSPGPPLKLLAGLSKLLLLPDDEKDLFSPGASLLYFFDGRELLG
ncbi:hypothetical protein MuYL_0838 [Mucilaginibacter xinganensis]|uniref:Uncharacterized protein n=1 Tax=Mucilaginibacter xinganensis TaxID=1234841 RepID=A0A223NSV9_9SPHI|nr:hypothetical protein MuYL_0838 [Mucilaginibacter xinganensis]